MATGELRWLHAARRIALQAVELFGDDERGGFFLAPRTGSCSRAQEDLDDNPTPSGNSMLAFVLLRLARIYGDDELERRAAGVLRLVAGALQRAPSAFGWALSALDLYLSPPREIAIVGPADSDIGRAALRPSTRTPSWPSAHRRRCRSCAARATSTVVPPCTFASASPAARR